jgi:hypothetical protein
MNSPWLSIPLADYESHMALPQVAQAQLLSALLGRLLREHAPRAVAVIGCAGGNGFEQVPQGAATRVVGVDLNPAFLEQARARFGARLPGLELVAGDITDARTGFEPVDLVYAALVLEYVEPALAMPRLRAGMAQAALLVTVVQRPSEKTAAVTPSPFASLGALAPVLRLVDPEQLVRLARREGLAETGRWLERADGGKDFVVQCFRAE